jgi:hypothetical protein
VVFEVIPSPDEIAAGLAEIRRRRRLRWAVSLGRFACVAALTSFIQTVSDNVIWMAIPVVIWFLAYIFAMQYEADSLCPRCGKRFARWGVFPWPMTQQCLHCGQELRPRR